MAKFKGICGTFVLKVHSFLTYDRIKKHITGNGSANAGSMYFVEAGKTPRVINLYAVASTRYE